MLTGDLNNVQQLALLFLFEESDKRAADLEWVRFKHAAIAAHPELTKIILELDDNKPADETEYARPLSEEEISDYQPLSTEEIGATMDLFERFGLRMD